MKIVVILILALGLLFAANADAALTVTNKGGATPTGFEAGNTSVLFEMGSLTSRSIGQEFTISSAIMLDSISAAYRQFDNNISLTVTLAIDIGNDSSVDFDESITLPGTDFNSGGSSSVFWMEFDLSSYEDLVLPAGQSSFLITLDTVNPETRPLWLFTNSDPHAGGQMLGTFADPGNDMGFAVQGTPIIGDFDGDGNVDGNDFLKWQRGESPTSPLSPDDLSDWEVNFGAGGGGALAASVGTVPEPSSWLLALAAGLWVSGCVRRQSLGVC